ncbi:MAG: hypothetical protein IPK71_08365 [Myxococcales bacterium]|jgi:hypothetical protein|nr:hypothetical protein [Myxococcales bacterium]
MQLPKDSAHHTSIVRFVRYLARKLKRAGHNALAKDTTAAAHKLREAGRAWEDTDDAVQDALADRDGADDDLDGVAQSVRATLAGRGASASKEEPYTRIFHDGIGYYTAAPLAEEETRYEELSERITKHLPANDSVRKTAPAAIKKHLAEFKAAASALDKAERARGSARTDLEHTKRDTIRLVEKVYGALLTEHGKGKAETFFQKSAKSGKSKDDAEPMPAPEE